MYDGLTCPVWQLALLLEPPDQLDLYLNEASCSASMMAAEDGSIENVGSIWCTVLQGNVCFDAQHGYARQNSRHRATYCCCLALLLCLNGSMANPSAAFPARAGWAAVVQGMPPKRAGTVQGAASC